MPVKKDAIGRRSVQAEVEVAGTPEEAWQAIATGPGISSWFVPSTVEGHVGGAATANFGPGMESRATITAWDPPRRYEFESSDLGPQGPVVATEWIVETRSGGTCLVRVVHSWFSDVDDWDEQFAGQERGWVCFFRILRLYLAHFCGQRGASLQTMGMTGTSLSDAWKKLVEPLGLASTAAGQHVNSSSLPRLGGKVEHVGPAEDPEVLLTLDTPAPGVAHLFAMRMGNESCVSVRLYLYGDNASAVAAAEESRWQAWMSERFPA
jgi:uncharacterized protein YndB with AHSA1/START domain